MSSKIEFKKVCEHCGASFVAYKCSTRFCSQQCASRAYKEKKRAEHVEKNQSTFDAQNCGTIVGPTHIENDVSKLDFLSPAQCAQLLCMCRRSIYYYLQANQIPCIQFNGKTRIRRADIELLFDNANGYVRRPEKNQKTREGVDSVTEFYTKKEVLEKYHISNSWLCRVAKAKNIPQTISRGCRLLSKKHCDKIFGTSIELDGICEWYTSQEIARKFSMSIGNVYTFAHEKNIPKKKIGSVTYYSKKHVDEAKGVASADLKWYSYAEAMVKYKLTHDQLGHYIKRYCLTKKKVGKFTYILQSDLDKLMNPRIL